LVRRRVIAQDLLVDVAVDRPVLSVERIVLPPAVGAVLSVEFRIVQVRHNLLVPRRPGIEFDPRGVRNAEDVVIAGECLAGLAVEDDAVLHVNVAARLEHVHVFVRFELSQPIAVAAQYRGLLGRRQFRNGILDPVDIRRLEEADPADVLGGVAAGAAPFSVGACCWEKAGVGVPKSTPPRAKRPKTSLQSGRFMVRLLIASSCTWTTVLQS
jgi:hypothetical protein